MFDVKNCPSFIYKGKIDRLCEDLEETTKIKYFFCHIIFNNRQTFFLSNIYQLLKVHCADEIYKNDYLYALELMGDEGCYIFDENRSPESAVRKNILEEEFNIYKSYCTVKKSAECMFIFGAASDEKIEDYSQHYNKTISDFDKFCYFFVENMLDVIKESNPLYSNAIIFSDGSYRKRLINNTRQDKRLTKKERQCLQLIACGRKSHEIAYILGNKITTIDFHKKNIMIKMNAKNMPHAVMEALSRGEIGSLSNWYEKEDVMLLNNVVMKEDGLMGV